MTKYHNIFIIGMALLIAAAIPVIAMLHSKKDRTLFTSRTFLTEYGWGYDILANDSLFIHQEAIPGIGGKKGFAMQRNAQLAAKLVIRKIKSGINPSLSKTELQEILSPTTITNGKP